MEAVQRHVIKLFKKDKASSKSVPSSPTTANKSSWLRTKISSDEESDGAKYWTNAKTKRKLKQLAAKRELPPLPPGAKSSRPPDLFPRRINLETRGVESPAHIYEEIPSWAVGSEQNLICKDSQPMLPKETIPDSGFSNAGFTVAGNRKGFHISDTSHSYAQLAVPPPRPQTDEVDLLKVTLPHSMSLQDLDRVEASKQLLSPTRVPDISKRTPNSTHHPRDESVDGCFEYDIRQRTTSWHSPDSSQSSFRSCTSSGQDCTEASNDTFSEYDIRSEGPGDPEPDYDSMLLKIRDNLKLKEDVQRLVYSGSLFSVSTSDGATLTNASSLSEISTLAEDDVLPHRMSCSSLPRPPRRISQPAYLPSRPPKAPMPPPPAFHSVMDLSTIHEPPLHHKSESVSSVYKEEDAKLSCRVSNLKPDAIQKRRPSRSNGRPPNVPPRRTSTGSSNRLLADMVQRNHDIQTLLL